MLPSYPLARFQVTGNRLQERRLVACNLFTFTYSRGSRDCTAGRPLASSVHLASCVTRQTSPVSVPTSTLLAASSAGTTARMFAADGEWSLSPRSRQVSPPSTVWYSFDFAPP